MKTVALIVGLTVMFCAVAVLGTAVVICNTVEEVTRINKPEPETHQMQMFVVPFDDNEPLPLPKHQKPTG